MLKIYIKENSLLIKTYNKCVKDFVNVADPDFANSYGYGFSKIWRVGVGYSTIKAWDFSRK